MEYIFNEGRFDLPLEGRIDQTVNILALPDGSGVTYIISRDELRTGESLGQFVERQLKELAGQVKGYKLAAKPEVKKALPGTSEVIEFAGAFNQNGLSVHQRQVVLQLAGRQRVVILTLSSAEPFDETVLRAWSAVVGSFKPRLAS